MVLDPVIKFNISFFLIYPVIAALKIHVSSQTKALLDSFGTFRLDLRGDVEMKVMNNDVPQLIHHELDALI